tara:strand:- start:256 stop:387 length:132 start_codon:yes stop_codon:yes gene_type:complete
MNLQKLKSLTIIGSKAVLKFENSGFAEVEIIPPIVKYRGCLSI